MTSNVEARRKSKDDSNNGKLLNEVEAISKALYSDRNPSRSSSSVARNQPKSADKDDVSIPNLRAKHGSDDPSAKEKRSFWNWKPLKAFSHVRNRRFNCCFTLEVHSVEGLPSKFNDLSLCVHWKRRDGEVVTSPIKVVEGLAEFKEKLTHTCSVYGSRNGPHHSAKYEAKHFLLYAAVDGNPKLDLGKHRVDLTRLLPLTLEELEDEKSSGTWTTSFKLLGEAKGALMNVSFGYLVMGDTLAPNNKNMFQLLDTKPTTRSYVKPNQGDGKGSIRRAGSLPANRKSSMASQSMDDVKILHEVVPLRNSEFSSSVNVLYQKFDEEKSNSLVGGMCEFDVSMDNVEPVKQSSCSPSHSSKENIPHENEEAEFSVTEKVVPVRNSEFSGSVNVLCQKFSEENSNSLDGGMCEFDVSTDDVEPAKQSSCSPSHSSKENIAHENEEAEFSVTEKGLEYPDENLELGEDSSKVANEPDVKSCNVPEVHSGVEDEVINTDFNTEGEKLCTKESILEDLESVLNHVADLEKEGLDTPEAESESNDQENLVEDKPNGMMQSLGLDDITDSVADEFLSMLGVENSPVSFSSDPEPESPRERLLREFQKEAEASGCSLFGFDIDEEDVEGYDYYAPTISGDVEDYDYYAPTISGWEEFSEDYDSMPLDELEYPKIRAKVMEDLETQALMQEMGLDEKAFQRSQPNSPGGFATPIDVCPNGPSQLPPLGEGLGPFVQTKTGGFLRSMNPVLFESCKSGGSLIMQVSSPVVVPAELGSGVVEISQHLASEGLEKLSMQANKLMPLEDITGKTVQQIAWEASPHLESSERQNLLQDEPEASRVTSDGKKRVKRGSSSRKSKKLSSSSRTDGVDSEYVSLEDLAPLAMDKIEALSIEGLRIQSGMSDEEAPTNINALEGKRVTSTGSMGLEGAVGLQLLDLKDTGNDTIDGLMGLSLTLDEWMKLDSGDIDEEEQTSERTSKLLAAHHANCKDLSFLGKKKTSGLLGNNFTVALMVQLRDPLRDYEPVGTPMLALIQVERVFLPPKPKIYSSVSKARHDYNDEDDELESVAKGEAKVDEETKDEKTQEQNLIPQYTISEVHVAGMKTEPSKKKMWGSVAQQQSGSRWLLANGMGKNKNPFMKSKGAVKSSLPTSIKSQPGDTLWSISARFHGTGTKWKELATLNPHIRNPNVILPNETILLRR